MELFLDRRGDEITMTEEVVKAAAGNGGDGNEVIALLLGRHGHNITVTEDVFLAAASCGQLDDLKLPTRRMRRL